MVIIIFMMIEIMVMLIMVITEGRTEERKEIGVQRDKLEGLVKERIGYTYMIYAVLEFTNIT